METIVSANLILVDDIRLEIGSNLEKIRGSKVLVPLESPGFSD